MTTKAICKKLNVSQKALRLYEDLEIIVPKRDKNNYRNYDENDVLKLRQIILLKEMGIPLKSIKELISKNLKTENKVIQTLDVQLKVVNNRINELHSIKKILEQSINDILDDDNQVNYDEYFHKIDKCLSENKEKSKIWLDKWDFDSWAKDYDKTVKNNINDELHLFDKYDFVLDSVVKIINKNNALNVLDIGCGTGNLFGKLNDRINYVGVDQSIEMLLQAKRKYPHMNLRLGNFLNEPFVENEFDIIASTYAFHHLNFLEKQKAVNILLRYLKFGGRIVIGDLMFKNNTARIEEQERLVKVGRNDLWDEIEDEYYTDIEEIGRYAEKLNCIVKYEHIGNYTWILQIIKN